MKDTLDNINQPIVVAVIGSRQFNNYAYLKSILEWHNIKKIISGGAKVADTLAEKYALEKNIPTKIFRPNWKIGRHAALLRNKQIIDASEEIIAFWDKKSRGTAHAIKLAEELSKPVHIHWTKDYDADSKFQDIEFLGL